MYNNRKVDIIIAARMGSSRFPGKTLSDMSGKPMLLRLIERARRSAYVDGIIVATTDLPSDDAISEWCSQNEIPCFRGSSDNVLNRIFLAADKFKCETIVEILGDNPFVHSDLIDEAISCFINNEQVDFVSSLTREYKAYASDSDFFPVGVRVQVLDFKTLSKAESEAVLPYHKEHSTSFIISNPDRFTIQFIPASGKFSECFLPDYNFAVNTIEQFELINDTFNVLSAQNVNFSIAELVKYVKKNAEKFDGIKISN